MQIQHIKTIKLNLFTNMWNSIKNNFTYPFFLLNVFTLSIMVWQWFESSENFLIVLFTYLAILIVWFYGCLNDKKNF